MFKEKRALKTWTNVGVSIAAVGAMAMAGQSFAQTAPGGETGGEAGHATTYVPGGETGGETGAVADAKKKIEPWPESRSQESYNELLSKVLGGEGGEGGWGVLDMRRQVTFPALTGAELTQLFKGNVLYKTGAAGFELNFRPNGTVDGFIIEDKNLKGTWAVKGDQVCVETGSKKYTVGCGYATLVIDRVIFFKDDEKALFSGVIKKGS